MKSINSLLKPFDNKLESPFIMNPSRFASGAADFTDLYDASTGWTLATGMTISGGSFNYNAVPQQVRNSYKSLGLTLSDTLWYHDWDWNTSSDTQTDNYSWGVSSLANGTGNPSAGDSINTLIYANFSDYGFIVNAADAGSATNAFTVTTLANATRYYCRTMRTSATGHTLRGYTNDTRTTTAFTEVSHTIPSTAGQGLNYIQHYAGYTSHADTTTGSTLRDDVYDGVAP